MRTFLTLFLVPAAFGQLFSFGVKVGSALTDPFAEATFQGTAPPQTIQTTSDAKGYLAGPMIELNLPFGISINADGIYRPLRLTQTFNSPFFQGTVSGDYSSWEVTPAARYRFLHTPIVKPFLEAGPSFRILSSRLDPYMSGRGFTLGGGVEVKLLHFRITPELRYTRWGSDRNVTPAFPLQTNQNQAEFLAGFSF